MAKYLNRLAARIARESLRESAKEGKSWIVTKKLILETEEGEMEFDAGDAVEIGTVDDGDNGLDMAMKGSAAVVVVADPDLASKIADIVVSADELSDVNFVEKPALDAVLGGEDVDSVIDKLADDEVAPDAAPVDDIEVAEVDIENKESVESKFARFGENRMNPDRPLICEAISIEDCEDAPINLAVIRADRIAKESFDDYAKFAGRVSELKGSIQPGAREIALTESGKVMGSFDKEANLGILYTENFFEEAEEMDNFNTEPEALMQDVDLGVESVEEVEESLKQFEESAKSGKDYIALVESLASEKVGLKEEVIAKIASTFENKTLVEGVRIFDTKLGKHINALKESVDADNFIAEAEEVNGEKGRFTKRFFA